MIYDKCRGKNTGPQCVKMDKSRKMNGHGRKQEAFKLLFMKVEGKRPFGRHRHR
jgi:hypothetical protein